MSKDTFLNVLVKAQYINVVEVLFIIMLTNVKVMLILL